MAKNNFGRQTERRLKNVAIPGTIVRYRTNQVIYSLGDRYESVLYLEEGSAKVTTALPGRKEISITPLYAGEFLGEECTTGRSVRQGTAVALEPTIVLEMGKQQIIRALYGEGQFSDRLVSHILKHNVRIEEGLEEQAFSSIERRLARTLLLVAQYGEADRTEKGVVDRMSTDILAEMIGTTPKHVSAFMGKFRELGYIQDGDGVYINRALVSVVLDA